MTAKQGTGKVLIAVFAASILVATACTSGGPAASGAPTAAASGTEKPQQGGRIIEGTTSDIATMQPILVADTASGRITTLIYDTILIQDPKTGEPVSRMATFSISADSLTYTFEIKANVNWSDGKPVIAQDWLTGMMAVGKSAKTVRKSNFQDVQGFNDYKDAKATTITGVTIDAANPKKWTVKMAKVSCPAIIQLIGYTLPTQVFGKYVTATSKPEDIDAAVENTAPTVASGPFSFKEWRKGDQVILAKNPTYWQSAPNVDECVY